ncbi:Transcription termination factor 3 mitochondrial [Bienertia sinuspersici]
MMKQLSSCNLKFVGSLNLFQRLRLLSSTSNSILTSISSPIKKEGNNNAYTYAKFLVHSLAFSKQQSITISAKLPNLFTMRSHLFRDILIKVEHKFGIPRDSAMLLYGANLLYLCEEKLENRCEVFKSFGWNQSDVMVLIRRNPLCLLSSKGRLKERLGFLMNQLGYEPNYWRRKLHCSLAAWRRDCCNDIKSYRRQGEAHYSVLTVNPEFMANVVVSRFSILNVPLFPIFVQRYGKLIPWDQMKVL